MAYLTIHQSINIAGYYTLLSLPFIVAVLKTCGRVFPHVGAQIPSASPNVPKSHSSFGWQDQALFLESFQLVHGIVQEDHLQLQILRYAVHKGGRVSLNEEGFFFFLASPPAFCCSSQLHTSLTTCLYPPPVFQLHFLILNWCSVLN
jgi:hypothetical protein